MGGEGTDRATVVVVDDEETLADMYTLWLREDYDVRTVYEGEAVLPAIDETVDVVLLDRRMPGYSGDEVLEMLQRRDVDLSVVVITAVDPDMDILEMPFDDYLCKPVQHDDLIDAIEQQLLAREHRDQLQEYLQLLTKKKLLEAEKTGVELAEREEFGELQSDLDTLEDRLRRTVENFEGVLEAYRSINRGPGRTRSGR
jgi:DNA-binding response OmpR family regulator